MIPGTLRGWLSIFFLTVASLRVQCQTRFNTQSTNVHDLAFTVDGNSIAIADQTTIKLFSVGNQNLLREFKGGHKNDILAIDISMDNSVMISGDKDGTIVIWNFTNATVIKTLQFQKSIVTSLDLSKDNRYLLSGGTDNNVYLYDIKEDHLTNKFSVHTKEVTSVEFSPSNNKFASGGGDGMTFFYSIDNTYPIATLADHKDWVRDVSFSLDGTTLATCGDDSHVIQWNVSDPNNIGDKRFRRFDGGWLVSVDFGEKNTSYAVGTSRGHLWIDIGLGRYHTKIPHVIRKVSLRPGLGENLVLAVATMGGGVILVSSSEMKLKTK